MADKKTYKAVRVADDGKLKLEDTEFPKVSDDHVLVKIEAFPINPTDIITMRGGAQQKKNYPKGIGFEGAGTVAEVGKNHAERLKVGDQVCVSHWEVPNNGCWAEYACVPGDGVYIRPSTISVEEAASHFVNPFTVALMLQEVQKQGHKAVIHSAGASALGKMMIRLFKENGIKTINLVRRDDVKEELKNLGADYVLNIKDQDFEAQIEELAKKENATMFYDAIAGDFTAKVLSKMPFGSIANIYGCLSGDFIVRDLHLADLLFYNKKVGSFGFMHPFHALSKEGKADLVKFIYDRLNGSLSTTVQKVFPLDKLEEAIAYYEPNASKGKVVIKP